MRATVGAISQGGEHALAKTAVGVLRAG